MPDIVSTVNLYSRTSAPSSAKDMHMRSRTKSGLIITHTGYILDYIEADVGHVLIDGYMRCSGNPREILKSVKASGYKECIACQK